jgi:lysophospholipase L1-like esterase
MRDIAPDDPALRYAGGARVDLAGARARFDRGVGEAGGFRHDAPGTRICLRTDATRVTMRVRGNGLHARRDAVNSVVVVEVDGEWSGARHVDVNVNVVVDVDVLLLEAPALRDIAIWLPYGESLDFEGLRVNAGARVQAWPAPARPRYVAYGDSITQGFRASDVSHTYPALVAAANGWEAVNLGFGSRQATAEDGWVVGAAAGDLVSVLIGFNDHFHNTPLARYRAEVGGLLRNIRAGCPSAPICVITPLWSSEPFPTSLGLHLEDYRQVLRDVAARSGDAGMRIIEGPELIPADGDLFADGVHPNDRGFGVMAANLATLLKPEMALSARRQQKQGTLNRR